ncbi:hypothetical protein [Leptospira alexanderi]|uniref:Uncharacterized protein n=1 Tax=Leptospira alexanderi serovar Manhao 3 str. L 60 TaxID=1049759 RepID=V6I6Q4_9LEPT|nr:hypothetical protein [Leptospira alexanderi]EQA61834.1 hypothetical protein LEP1GSC062_3236 [Leptospira alexanderi serovar Manhao 3 str. L 60]
MLTFDLVVSGVTQKSIEANSNVFTDAFTISNNFGRNLKVKAIQIKYKKELKTAQIKISQNGDSTPFIKETPLAQLGSSHEAEIGFKLFPVNLVFTHQSNFSIELKPAGVIIDKDDVSVSLFCDHIRAAAPAKK